MIELNYIKVPNPSLIVAEPSVCITSTNSASVGSSLTFGSVFSKYGPAGSNLLLNIGFKNDQFYYFIY